MNVSIARTTSDNEDFKELVRQLDEDLAIRDGEDHDFYHQFNSIANMNYVIVLYENKSAVACGAIKKYASGLIEMKRMFTLPEKRGLGYAGIILKELSEWATEMNYKRLILETGVKQPEAIALYKKHQFQIIENYGQYKGVQNSVCFERIL